MIMHYIYNFLKLLLLGFLLVFLIIGNVQGNESQVKLTPEEQAWLDQNPTVRVYILDYPPYMIVKSNEAPQGIVIEYLKLIGKRSGITFKFETSDLPFAEFMESMERFQGPDLLPLLRRTAEREQFLVNSSSLFQRPISLLPMSSSFGNKMNQSWISMAWPKRLSQSREALFCMIN